MGVTRWLSNLWFIYDWLPAHFFLYFKFITLHYVTTHLHEGKMVRILSQLREFDLPVDDASRTLPSSSGLLEVLPIYQLSVDYTGSKVYSVSWGSLTFPSVMRTERCFSSSGLLEVLPIYRRWVGYIGSSWLGTGYGDRCAYPRMIRYPPWICYFDNVC